MSMFKHDGKEFRYGAVFVGAEPEGCSAYGVHFGEGEAVAGIPLAIGFHACRAGSSVACADGYIFVVMAGNRARDDGHKHVEYRYVSIKEAQSMISVLSAAIRDAMMGI